LYFLLAACFEGKRDIFQYYFSIIFEISKHIQMLLLFNKYQLIDTAPDFRQENVQNHWVSVR